MQEILQNPICRYGKEDSPVGTENFKPAYMIVAGKFKEYEKSTGALFWDDRDPSYRGKAGIVSGYIFRKRHPCKTDLGHLKVKQDGDTFYLLDNGIRVSLAIVNYYHENHADVYIETFEPFRRRGYATKLLGWVSDRLMEQNYIQEAGCAADNMESLLLHLKLGFQVVGHIRWSND